jgi:F0F1-type ATP synthase assembly protein I
MTKYIILIIAALFGIIIGVWALLNYTQTPWGLLVSLTSVAALGAGLSNLEKHLKKYDFKNRNK